MFEKAATCPRARRSLSDAESPNSVSCGPSTQAPREAELDNGLKQNLTRLETWIRVLYVILFAVIYMVAEIVLVAVVVVQFGFVLISGKRNQNLLQFGGRLSRYMYDVLLYFTFRSDNEPFPFDDWPAADRMGSAAGTTKKTERKKALRKKKTSSSA